MPRKLGDVDCAKLVLKICFLAWITGEAVLFGLYVKTENEIFLHWALFGYFTGLGLIIAESFTRIRLNSEQDRKVKEQRLTNVEITNNECKFFKDVSLHTILIDMWCL